MKTSKLYILSAALLCLASSSCVTGNNLTSSMPDRSSSYISPGNLERTTANPADQKNYHVSSDQRHSTLELSNPLSQRQSEYISGQVASTVGYNIDGMDYTGEAFSDDEMLTIFARLVSFARSGHKVSIADKGTTANREVVDTLASADENEVVEWVARMVRKGYSVTVDWDAEARLYRCTAYRKTK